MSKLNSFNDATVRTLAETVRKVSREVRQLKELIANHQPRQHDLVIVRLTDTLLPGGSATGNILWRKTDSGGGGDRLEDVGPEVTINDPAKWAFGLTGMDIACLRRNRQFCTLPGQNINGVFAKVKTGVTIASGGSGLVEIWEEGSASGVEVTAYLNWIHTESIAAATQIRITWKPAQSKWVIVDNACGA